MEVGVQYMPGAAVEDPRPASAQITSYDVSLNVPVPLGAKTYLIPGLAYHVESVSFSDTPQGFTELRAFHSLEAPLLLVHLLPRAWSVSFRISPGLAGDFRRFDSGLGRASGLALATRSFSENLVVGAGGIAGFSFGSILPLPAAYLDWKPAPGFQVEAFVPSFIVAKYTVRDRIEVGLRANVTGNSYAVRDRRIAAAWPCASSSDDPATSHSEAIPRPMQCLDHIAYSTATAGPIFSVRLVGTVWWTASVGRSLFRRLQQQNDRNDSIPGGVQNLPNVIFALTGVTWRLPH